MNVKVCLFDLNVEKMSLVLSLEIVKTAETKILFTLCRFNMRICITLNSEHIKEINSNS